MKPIKRYAIKENFSEYMKFVMEIPISCITLNDKTKNLYQKIVDPNVNDNDCLHAMGDMVELIEREDDKEKPLTFLEKE